MRRCSAHIFLLLFGFFLYPSVHAADKIGSDFQISLHHLFLSLLAIREAFSKKKELLLSLSG